jgi:hydroxyacylglutathione hydrolase
LAFDVLFIPGHTHHHVALWLPQALAVFTGDTLFLGGCGRLFEGTSAQMWASLLLLAELPDATQVYCGHEYTMANAKFALSLAPDDPAFVLACEQAVEKRKAGRPTVPGTIAFEKAANPFLRLAETGFREKLYPGMDAVGAFASLRHLKDAF